MKQIAPSALFIRSPSGFERFGLRFAPVGAKRMSTGHPAPSRGRSKDPENLLKMTSSRGFFLAENHLAMTAGSVSLGFDRGLFSVFSAFVSQLWKQKLLKKLEESGILLVVSEI